MDLSSIYDLSVESMEIELKGFENQTKFESYSNFIKSVYKLKNHDYGFEGLYDSILSREEEEQPPQEDNKEEEPKEEKSEGSEEGEKKDDKKSGNEPGFFRKAWAAIKAFFRKIGNFIKNVVLKIRRYFAKKKLAKYLTKFKEAMKDKTKMSNEVLHFYFVAVYLCPNVLEVTKGLYNAVKDTKAEDVIKFNSETQKYKENVSDKELKQGVIRASKAMAKVYHKAAKGDDIPSSLFEIKVGDKTKNIVTDDDKNDRMLSALYKAFGKDSSGSKDEKYKKLVDNLGGTTKQQINPSKFEKEILEIFKLTEGFNHTVSALIRQLESKTTDKGPIVYVNGIGILLNELTVIPFAMVKSLVRAVKKVGGGEDGGDFSGLDSSDEKSDNKETENKEEKGAESLFYYF